jgi:hypothetical protein
MEVRRVVYVIVLAVLAALAFGVQRFLALRVRQAELRQAILEHEAAVAALRKRAEETKMEDGVLEKEIFARRVELAQKFSAKGLTPEEVAARLARLRL